MLRTETGPEIKDLDQQLTFYGLVEGGKVRGVEPHPQPCAPLAASSPNRAVAVVVVPCRAQLWLRHGAPLRAGEFSLNVCLVDASAPVAEPAAATAGGEAATAAGATAGL